MPCVYLPGLAPAVTVANRSVKYWLRKLVWKVRKKYRFSKKSKKIRTKMAEEKLFFLHFLNSWVPRKGGKVRHSQKYEKKWKSLHPTDQSGACPRVHCTWLVRCLHTCSLHLISKVFAHVFTAPDQSGVCPCVHYISQVFAHVFTAPDQSGVCPHVHCTWLVRCLPTCSLHLIS